jgi:hypothetical protein
MPFCGRCGKELPEEAGFCPNCGAAVTQTVTSKVKIPANTNLFKRMIRAAKLETSLYEEVEADPTATGQAMLAVAIASVCAGIGSGLDGILRGLSGEASFFSLIFGVATALFSWLVWSFVTYIVGTRVFGGTATYGELLRTIGFSDSPGAIRILTFIPFIGGIVSAIAFLWVLIAMVTAVRQALDFTTGKAILTCIVGLILLLVLAVLLAFLSLPFL